MEPCLDDIFYDTSFLSMVEQANLLKDAYAISYDWWADIKDSSTNYSRKAIEVNFEWIMEKLTKECKVVFIHRRGFRSWGYKLEVGFCTFTNPEYFLWIHVAEDKIPELAEKYKLEKL